MTLSVAFLGPPGTFSHAAVLKQFGSSVELVPTTSIPAVFQCVTAKQTQYGVVPIENSTEGVVNTTIDEFIDNNVTICGETTLAIHHHLLIDAEDKTDINKIYSHPQSLGQCRRWLQVNMPNVPTIAVVSNAQAALQAKQEAGAAAIAGDVAAKQYSLKKQAENIEDNPENITRFLILSREAVEPSGDDKTSLLIYAQNTPGALLGVCKPFADNNINITLPTSRPTGQKNWSYVFYLEISGHQHEPNVKKALNELSQSAGTIKILGSYPKAPM